MMMKYSTEYVFAWTYKENPKGRSIYTAKYFDTESERNKFALDVFTQAKQNKIVLFYAEEKDIKRWKKPLDKINGLWYNEYRN